MLFAVHISDGVLNTSWLVGGWLLAILIITVTAWKFDDTMIPRVGVLTAVFFVGSQIHVPLGGVSVHLLLNGLMGVLLGYRSCLAIAVGLLLQALLFGHGGFTTLGVNICVYSIPAIVVGITRIPLQNAQFISATPIRFGLVFLTTVIWLSTAVVAGQWGWQRMNSTPFDISGNDLWSSNPWVIFGVITVSLGCAGLEKRIESHPNFPIGLLLGAGTAYTTVVLNFLTLAFGADATLQPVAAIVLLTHMPVILIESLGTGFILAYLSRVKPEWMGITNTHHLDSGKTSSNGTSH